MKKLLLAYANKLADWCDRIVDDQELNLIIDAVFYTLVAGSVVVGIIALYLS